MSRHLSTVPREKLPMHCLKELQLKGKDCICEMLINIRRIRRCTTLRLHDRNIISEVTKEEKVGAWEMLGDRGVVNSDVCSTQKCRWCDCHEPKTTATKLWSSEFRGEKIKHYKSNKAQLPGLGVLVRANNRRILRQSKEALRVWSGPKLQGKIISKIKSIRNS